MAFVFEKTPKPGEPGRDFYEFINSNVNHVLPSEWVVDKERGVVLFHTGNNARTMGDGDEIYPIKFFNMVGRNIGDGVSVYEEIISKEKKSNDCLVMKINLRLSHLTLELWEMAKEALIAYGSGPLLRYKKIELVVLNDDAIKGVK